MRSAYADAHTRATHLKGHMVMPELTDDHIPSGRWPAPGRLPARLSFADRKRLHHQRPHMRRQFRLSHGVQLAAWSATGSMRQCRPPACVRQRPLSIPSIARAPSSFRPPSAIRCRPTARPSSAPALQPRPPIPPAGRSSTIPAPSVLRSNNSGRFNASARPPSPAGRATGSASTPHRSARRKRPQTGERRRLPDSPAG